MPKTADTIGFEHKGIGAVLAHNRLIVPMNQREYSWEEDHVKALFQDYANAIANGVSYFLGTIVLTHGKQKDLPEVSDGQQRLATTTILLASMRDYFFERGDTKRAESIEQDYLKTTELETEQTVPKLRLNIDDSEFFIKRILSRPNTPERSTPAPRDSHKRIAKAAKLAREHVESIVQPHGDTAKVQRLIEWVKFIKDEAQVILLKVPDHLNAFVMFETLNDRGLKASQADLLKNYLLSQAGESHIVEAQQRWAKMIAVLESMGEEDITVTYLKHLLTWRRGHTKEREVYAAVRETVTSQQKSIEFLDLLAEAAIDYAALLNPSHVKWNAYGNDTKRHLKTISSVLKVEQIRPLMFAVARNFNVQEAKRAFRLFVCWSVRFLIVGGRGGFLDTNYARAAHEVGKGKITTVKQLREFMIDVIPTDAVFEAAFADARVEKGYLARYYLRALEMKQKADPQPELVPNEEEEEINLEHILPENPESNWPEVDPEVAAAYYNRIGNMVLLKAKKNSTIGNDSFADKRKVLASSAFILTSEAGKAKQWDKSKIQDRQKKLAQLAVETWPLSV
jgi:hypothetical protein